MNEWKGICHKLRISRCPAASPNCVGQFGKRRESFSTGCKTQTHLLGTMPLQEGRCPLYIWGTAELIDAHQPQWEWRFALLLLHLGKHSQKSNSQKEGSRAQRDQKGASHPQSPRVFRCTPLSKHKGHNSLARTPSPTEERRQTGTEGSLHCPLPRATFFLPWVKASSRYLFSREFGSNAA